MEIALPIVYTYIDVDPWNTGSIHGDSGLLLTNTYTDLPTNPRIYPDD